MSLNSSTVSPGDAATSTQYNNLRKDAVELGADFVTSTGSVNAYAVSVDAQVTSYTSGLVVAFLSNFANTGSATLNVNSLGAKTIKKNNDRNLESGDIESGQLCVCQYDGTNFQMLSQLGVALTAAEIANLNGITTTASNLNYLSEGILSRTVGENVTALDAAYLKSSDGKAWRAVTTSAGEAVENFIGFFDSTVTTGNSSTILTGPIISRFSGLTAGSVYFLTDTAGSISTTPGTIHKPVGLAISSTTLFLFPTQAFRSQIYQGTLTNPGAAGATADTTITFGFRPRNILVTGKLVICDAAGSVCTFRTFQYMWDGTTVKGGTYIETPNGTGALNVANALTEFSTANPVVTPASGANRSSLTLSVNSVSATTLVLRLTNATVAGSGSTNGQSCIVSVEAIG